MTNHSFYDSHVTAAGFLREQLAHGEHRLMEYINNRGGLVLDVGCGSGRLHDAFTNVDQIVGIDYALAQLALYRRLHPEAPLVNADATHLPFFDNSFDSVLLGYHMIESVLGVQSRFAAISEAARILRPGGLLCLTRHVRRNYRLPRQILHFVAGRVNEFGDVRGGGSNHAGGVSLEGFTMHILSDSEMRVLAKAAQLKAVTSWDFDDGRCQRRRSRAVIQIYSKG
ncbi:class I SAM-dependent methyltransferase [Williamsia soli]|uniref:class I SAM-dependent methyltransferase n=1 Tax=Williamsia soli TaxID=364929 RepID=UPI001A9F074D|nr:class I SAM-dependent methyltransferase [Williamsia soli]